MPGKLGKLKAAAAKAFEFNKDRSKQTKDRRPKIKPPKVEHIASNIAVVAPMEGRFS